MTISHYPLSVCCAECANQRWLTIVWMPDGSTFQLTTCVQCDAPDADTPFAD